jgi:hypothetical protein
MEELDLLINSEPDELISALDAFQAEIVNTFLENTSSDYLKSVDMWLNAAPSNTAKFGGDVNASKIYREKLLDELEKFLCGNKQYDAARKEIGQNSVKTKEYLIGALSTAIGAHIGIAATFIAPAIVLFLINIAKMPLNAWCAMRTELKTTT